MCCGHPQWQTVETRMTSSDNQLEMKCRQEKFSHEIDLLPLKMRFHTGETVWWFLKTLNILLSYDPTILLLGIYPKKIESRDLKNIYTPIFITALFTTVKR